MSKQQSKYEKLLEQVVGFRRVYATVSGSACGGLFLSQAKFWDTRTSDPEGWFYKTYADWERETALNRTELDKIRHHLENMEIIETWKKGKPAKLYYRVNNAKLDEFLDAVLDGTFQASRPKSPNPRKTRKIADGQQSSSLLTVNNSKFADGQQTSVADGQQTSVADGQQTILYTKNTNIDYKTEREAAPHSQKSVDVKSEQPALTPKSKSPIIQPVAVEPVTELKTTLVSSTVAPSDQKELPVNSVSTALTHEGKNSGAAPHNSENHYREKQYSTYVLAMIKKWETEGKLPTDIREINQWAKEEIGEYIQMYRKSGHLMSSSATDISSDFLVYVANQWKGKDADTAIARIHKLEYHKTDWTPRKWQELAILVTKWQASKATGDRNINISQKYQEAIQPETRLERIMRERREAAQRAERG
ncbi:hypothetical protein [Brasilonema sp. UFV-L1]|uniref:hypothetical protein n=1 Tax=Brasilonema sp. UFV-L1 TaxID=2234130 RepID=UPI00145DA5B9|nr:hypothetical protein [Brasilonema sp. UFV-L1]NMG10819.1 hypothetical protein [Brasilonema sp. UFV-L1]